MKPKKLYSNVPKSGIAAQVEKMIEEDVYSDSENEDDFYNSKTELRRVKWFANRHVNIISTFASAEPISEVKRKECDKLSIPSNQQYDLHTFKDKVARGLLFQGNTPNKKGAGRPSNINQEIQFTNRRKQLGNRVKAIPQTNFLIFLNPVLHNRFVKFQNSA
ncbi:unnamed protein product [Lepeophtheirus salmonis]|uniref:(salmon louse) hypothetical protein n=1 Tax=Lepeophtheirus salmonis TaxID=72036 RepID=A0A7R8CEB8_LEPSM|nr:unnamed protein product [Lepeophtheirus salmonis]CAF2794575.1 unnamed protein product [Lepeophtheirus salmonis]